MRDDLDYLNIFQALRQLSWHWSSVRPNEEVRAVLEALVELEEFKTEARRRQSRRRKRQPVLVDGTSTQEAA